MFSPAAPLILFFGSLFITAIVLIILLFDIDFIDIALVLVCVFVAVATWLIL